MAKDHYVAKTYLDWFTTAEDKLVVYSKQWGTVKLRTTGQVCYEEGGSDNPFLVCSRAVEDYLRPFENGWNDAIRTYSGRGPCDFKDYLKAKQVIAGYLPYLKLFTPASVRIQKQQLAAVTKTSLKILIRKGKIPPPPSGLEWILDDVEKNFDVDVDEKYPKAIASGVLVRMSQAFYKYPWMRVENHSNAPFVTSDNPACFLYLDDSSIPLTYVPLTPHTGLLMKPFINSKDRESYDHSSDVSVIAKPEFVNRLNELVIKNAEKIIIANHESQPIQEQVSSLKDWQHGCSITKINVGSGEAVITKILATEKCD